MPGRLQRHRLPRPRAVAAGAEEARHGHPGGVRRRDAGWSSACYGATARSRSWPTGRAAFTTAYSEISSRCRRGSCRWAAGCVPVEPAELVDAVVRRPAGASPACTRRPARTLVAHGRAGAGRPSRPGSRAAPQRRSRPSASRCCRRCSRSCSQRCGDEPSRAGAVGRARGALPPQPAGAAGAASTCSTWSTSAAAATRSTARPRTAAIARRQGALRRRLPPPGPALAARGQGPAAGARRGRAAGRSRGRTRSLQTVREKVEAAFGRFPLADTPMPQQAGDEESAVTILNEGVRSRRLVRDHLPVAVDATSSRAHDRAVPAAPRRARLVRRGLRSQPRRRGERSRSPTSSEAELLPTSGTSRAPRWATSTTRWAATWASPGCGSRPSARGGSCEGRPGATAARGRLRGGRRHLRLARVADPRDPALPRRRRGARARRRAPPGGRGRRALLRELTAPSRPAEVRQRDARVALQVAAVAVGDVQPPVARGERVGIGLEPLAQRREGVVDGIGLGGRPRGARRRGSTGTRPGRCRSRRRGRRTRPRRAARAGATATATTGSGGRPARRRRRSRRSDRRRCRHGTSRRRPTPAAPGAACVGASSASVTSTPSTTHEPCRRVIASVFLPYTAIPARAAASRSTWWLEST